MKTSLAKRILVSVSSLFFLLLLVLAVHIYLVTRPKLANDQTKAMARIDIRQTLTSADADKITAWLSRQNGVEHVMLNASNRIAVFTFYPVKNNADNITTGLKQAFNLDANRYKPTEKELMAGCPIGSHSSAGTIYQFFKQLF